MSGCQSSSDPPGGRPALNRQAGLDHLFHPRSIAVVGASGGPFAVHTMMFLDTLIKLGYEGHLYPVGSSQEVSGLKAYRNLKEIPGTVDHVISLIPAAATLDLARDCAFKEVKSMQLFTAGFAETGEAEGMELQRELVKIARDGGMRIIGPNCMGIYCPASGLSYCPDFPGEAGNVAFISQSGSYTYLLVRMAAARGIRFSKVVSYGNAADVNEIELLDYLSGDPETAVICAYFEGTGDGAQFLRALTQAASTKPVVIIKKGHTRAGARGASSHTGALAGNDRVWDGAVKQARALRVEDVEEMVDLLVTFRLLPLPKGRKAAVLGVGGGASVRASDQCEAGGLVLPPVPDGIRAHLKKFVPLAGSMLGNPVDVLAERYTEAWAPLVQALDSWDDPDILIWQISPEIEPLREEVVRQYMIDMRRRMMQVFCSARKPKAVVVHAVESGPGLESLDALRHMCQEHGIAFYPSLYRAARAIRRYVDCTQPGTAPQNSGS